MLANMPEEQKQIITGQYGSEEEFEKHFMKQALETQPAFSICALLEMGENVIGIIKVQS